MAASYEQTGTLYPNPYLYGNGIDHGISHSTATTLTIAAESAHRRASLPESGYSPRPIPKRSKKNGSISTIEAAASQIHNTDPALMSSADASPAIKPRRVRTGCLTCRERHLKCDEATPICMNCRKSSRQCKRGVRLNFIDTNVRQPPIMTPIRDWHVEFQDDSRTIASEYVGGSERYAAVEQNQAPNLADGALLYGYTRATNVPGYLLPPLRALPDPFVQQAGGAGQPQQPSDALQRVSIPQSNPAYSTPNPSVSTVPPYGHMFQGESGHINDFYIHNVKELRYIQSFVEDVGTWMDSMDPNNHFSDQLPHLALPNSMLYNAFLACGARHLSFLAGDQDPVADTDALSYYDTATMYLLQALQLPDGNRDSVMLATTATILEVYELMSKRVQHINHIRGARALIRECGWNARSEGVGGACFWLNVSMEVLSCLADFDKADTKDTKVTWNPDEWDVDTEWGDQTVPDEIWSQRVLYLVAKVVNFRVDAKLFDEQAHLTEWQRLQSLLEAWSRNAPRTMHIMGYIEDAANSSFPEIWLVRRTATRARLLYHIGLLLHSQSHSDPPAILDEMRHENAIAICGIAAHNKHGNIASVSIRGLAIAGEVITDLNQQREILDILAKLSKKAGWDVHNVLEDLPRKWGWTEEQRTAHQRPFMDMLLPPPVEMLAGGDARPSDNDITRPNSSALQRLQDFAAQAVRSQHVPILQQRNTPPSLPAVAVPTPRSGSTGLGFTPPANYPYQQLPVTYPGTSAIDNANLRRHNAPGGYYG